MSQLGQLKVIGPITPCNRTVRIQNQVVNANVVLTLKPPTGLAIPIGGGPASWPDQSFTLTQALIPGHTVVAVQTMSGFSPSDEATLPVNKSPTPAELSKGTFALPIHACAKCILLYGLVPGAEVEVQTSLAESLGKAIVPENGEVEVDLVREILDNEFLQAFVRCGSISASMPIFAGVGSVRPPKPLLPPTIDPITECDSSITVSGIVPGAQVTIFRDGQRIGPACSPIGRLMFVNIKPLKKPDDNTIEVQQEFPFDLCRELSPKGSATLLDRSKLNPPGISSPLCEGGTSITLSALHPGATVELTVNGSTILLGAASTTMPNYPVSPLQSPQTVTARQNTCGEPTSWSPYQKEPVNSSKPVLPKLFGPVDGATAVPTNVTLQWTDPGTFCNRAAAFDLQVSIDKTFMGVIAFSQNNITSLAWMVFPALQYDTTYFWRVRSHRGALTTLWTKAFQFTTVKKSQQPSPPGQTPPDGDIRRDRCFVQDCCPNYRRVIKQYGTYNEAYENAVLKSPASCTIEPLEVPCDSKVAPCSFSALKTEDESEGKSTLA